MAITPMTLEQVREQLAEWCPGGGCQWLLLPQEMVERLVQNDSHYGLRQTEAPATPDLRSTTSKPPRERLDGRVHRTPCRRSRTFSDLCGGEVWLKYENLQRTGSYKIRGALNRILTLPEQARARGVIAASAGNHAQGVAVAARSRASRPRSSCPRPRRSPKSPPRAATARA